MNPKNTESAIAALKKAGFNVESKNEKFLIYKNGAILHDCHENDYVDGRGLVKTARAYLKTRRGNEIVKSLTAKPLRRKARQKIRSEDFDAISGERRGSKNNPWNFD